MSDINIGQISEALNDKMDRDGMNSQSPCAVVVAKQDPTSANGYKWYRVYSDGWCEQGGLSNGGGSSFVTTTFLKPFANTAYNIVTGLLNDENNSTCFGVKVANRTSTSFQSRTWYSSGSAGNYNFNWQASGYIA